MGVVQVVTAVIAFAYTALAIGLFARACRELLTTVRLGTADRTRSDDRAMRVKTMLRETLGHTRMLQWTWIGAAHWLVFVGFFSLFPILATAYLEALNPEWTLPWVGHWEPWLLLSEIIAAVTGLGILALFGVRLASQPRAHQVPEQGQVSEGGQRSSSSRFENSRQWQAFYIEATIFAIVACFFIIRSSEFALGGIDAAWASPVSAGLANLFDGASTEALHTTITVTAGVKIVVSWTFFLMLALVPSMGIGWHRVTAFFNIYFKRHADGATSLGAVRPMLIDGEPADFETADPETQPFGAATITDFSWKGLLDFTTCTECGRCQSQCPAWNTGKPLSPRSSSPTCATTSTSRPLPEGRVRGREERRPGRPAREDQHHRGRDRPRRAVVVHHLRRLRRAVPGRHRARRHDHRPAPQHGHDRVRLPPRRRR
ncbi:hypothetical protein GCM10029992_16710 [Glycomyces albus]